MTISLGAKSYCFQGYFFKDWFLPILYLKLKMTGGVKMANSRETTIKK
jgi:hypothetical protein